MGKHVNFLRSWIHSKKLLTFIVCSFVLLFAGLFCISTNQANANSNGTFPLECLKRYTEWDAFLSIDDSASVSSQNNNGAVGTYTLVKNEVESNSNEITLSYLLKNTSTSHGLNYVFKVESDILPVEVLQRWEPTFWVRPFSTTEIVSYFGELQKINADGTEHQVKSPIFLVGDKTGPIVVSSLLNYPLSVGGSGTGKLNDGKLDYESINVKLINDRIAETGIARDGAGSKENMQFSIFEIDEEGGITFTDESYDTITIDPPQSARTYTYTPVADAGSTFKSWTINYYDESCQKLSKTVNVGDTLEGVLSDSGISPDDKYYFAEFIANFESDGPDPSEGHTVDFVTMPFFDGYITDSYGLPVRSLDVADGAVAVEREDGGLAIFDSVTNKFYGVYYAIPFDKNKVFDYWILPEDHKITEDSFIIAVFADKKIIDVNVAGEGGYIKEGSKNIDFIHEAWLSMDNNNVIHINDGSWFGNYIFTPVANEGYEFVNWTCILEDGKELTLDKAFRDHICLHSFSLVANFKLQEKPVPPTPPVPPQPDPPVPPVPPTPINPDVPGGGIAQTGDMGAYSLMVMFGVTCLAAASLVMSRRFRENS